MAITSEEKKAAGGTPAGAPGPATPWTQIPLEHRREEDERSLYHRIRSRFVRLAPKPIVRALARPYIAGERRQDALSMARRLNEEKGLHSTVDVLGEAIAEPAEAKTMLDEYLALLDDIGKSACTSISIKLSALGQGLDDRLCLQNVETLLKRAAQYDQFVRFDMEDHPTVDSTLAFYREFVPRFPKIGIVLQSRLFRTPEDVKRLASLRPNVRLCIGIYREKPEIAYQDKPTMKRRMIELLGAMWDNGQTVALATHDERVIREAMALAQAKRKGPESFEVEMLLGVPRTAIQQELIRMGLTVRLYVPYGSHWYQYCLRRLEHNPEMASLVLKNLLRIG